MLLFSLEITNAVIWWKVINSYKWCLCKTQGQVTTENTLMSQGQHREQVLETSPVCRVFHLCCVLYCVNSGSERAIVLGLLFTWLNLFKSTAEMFGFSPVGFGLYFNWRVCLVPGNIFFSTLNAWPIQILKVDFIIPGGERLKLSRLLARFPFHFGLCCKELRSLSPEALYSLSWLVFLDSQWDPGWPITAVNLSDSFLGTVSG